MKNSDIEALNLVFGLLKHPFHRGGAETRRTSDPVKRKTPVMTFVVMKDR